MRKYISAFLAFVMVATANGASTRTIEATNTDGFISGQNILKNSGFESGLTKGFSASGGTFAVTTTNPYRGSYMATWDSNGAAQTLTSSTYAIPVGMYGKNGVVSVPIKCASGTCTHTLTVTDGTNDLVTATTITSSTSTFERTTLNFIFPSSGNIVFKLASVAADEPSISLDEPLVGLADGYNLSQVSQAQFIGSAYIDTTSSCTVSRTNTALGAFTSTAACPGPTVEHNPGPGIIQTTDADLPKFTVNSLPPGRYEVRIQAYISAGASAVNCLTINDGTNSSGTTCVSPGTGTNAGATVIGFFNYTDTANRSFELYGSATSSSISAEANTGQKRFNFAIYRYPSTSELAYRAEQTNWFVDAQIAGTFNLNGLSNAMPTLSSATLTNSTAPGAATALIACATTTESSGTTCTAADEGAGISFTVPVAGSYEVCDEFSTYANATATNATFHLGETGNANQTQSQYGADTAYAGFYHGTGITGGQWYAFPTKVCHTFNFSSAGKKTVRLFATGGGSTLQIATTQRWFVRQLNFLNPTPIFVGSVTSNSTGAERVERLSVTNAGTPTIASQSGSWVSSLTDGGTGLTTVNITAGTFSSAPTCVATAGSANAFVRINSASTSAVGIETATVAGSPADTDVNFTLVCMGPK